MSKKDSLTLGSKLIGLYCLALGIAAWFKVFPAEFIRAGQLAQTDAIFRVSQWTSLISPVVLMFLGLYLIKDGSYVRDFAFRCDDEAPIEDPRDFFALGVQLYGAYLIVSWISTCLWIISTWSWCFSPLRTRVRKPSWMVSKPFSYRVYQLSLWGFVVSFGVRVLLDLHFAELQRWCMRSCLGARGSS